MTTPELAALREERLRLESEARALESEMELEATNAYRQQDWFYQEGQPVLRELLHHPDISGRVRRGIERLLEEYL